MVEIELDGKKVEIAEGSMVMHAADKAGTYIPHFCYHKKLSIAANCRMCLVDVEKAPKPMPACATPVTQGMIVRTKSDKAIKAQQSVMEFLLINHPLDCPICDQGGECQLQDLAVGYGGSSSRYDEEKRVVPVKDVGPLISMQEMSRCIHCTRCVRFGQEIAGVMELGMIHRGEHSEITTVIGDTVNVAARLEGLTKQTRFDLIIDRKTRDLVGPELKVRKLKVTRVRGRTQPMEIFLVDSLAAEDAGNSAETIFFSR